MGVAAKCQQTGASIDLAAGFFVADVHTGVWGFVSKDAPDRMGEYWIQASELVRSPEALVDWLAHLYEKSWFDPVKFFEFMHAFRKENDLYMKL